MTMPEPFAPSRPQRLDGTPLPGLIRSFEWRHGPGVVSLFRAAAPRGHALRQPASRQQRFARRENRPAPKPTAPIHPRMAAVLPPGVRICRSPAAHATTSGRPVPQCTATSPLRPQGLRSGKWDGPGRTASVAGPRGFEMLSKIRAAVAANFHRPGKRCLFHSQEGPAKPRKSSPQADGTQR